MIFLDTHIVIWLYQRSLELLSADQREAVEKNRIYVSPVILLEIEYLYEIGKIKKNSQTIIKYLSNKIDLTIDNNDFLAIINIARLEKWTRDPFDRIIVSHAKYRDAHLITKDLKIRKNYPGVIA